MARCTLEVASRFEAAHHLRSYRGAPEPVHGHSWRVLGASRDRPARRRGHGLGLRRGQARARRARRAPRPRRRQRGAAVRRREPDHRADRRLVLRRSRRPRCPTHRSRGDPLRGTRLQRHLPSERRPVDDGIERASPCALRRGGGRGVLRSRRLPARDERRRPAGVAPGASALGYPEFAEVELVVPPLGALPEGAGAPIVFLHLVEAPDTVVADLRPRAAAALASGRGDPLSGPDPPVGARRAARAGRLHAGRRPLRPRAGALRAGHRRCRGRSLGVQGRRRRGAGRRPGDAARPLLRELAARRAGRRSPGARPTHALRERRRHAADRTAQGRLAAWSWGSRSRAAPPAARGSSSRPARPRCGFG